MEFPYTVESQEAFDALVKDRLQRERQKFADYDELKAKAEQVDVVKVEADKALAEAVARAEAAEGRVGEFETKAQLASWRDEVAKATGVPVAALRGSTKEELEAHAAELKPLITGSGPVIPNQGAEPTGTAAGADADRAFADFLTGRGAD